MKKKYKLDDLLGGINKNNLHREIIAGESIGKEWPAEESEHKRSNFSKSKSKKEHHSSKSIPSKEEYLKANDRMEEIIKSNLVTNDTPIDDPLLQELVKVSRVVEAYEKIHFPIGEPMLIYQGYKGTVNGDEGSYWGKVLDTEPDGVFYQGATIEELEEDFKNALDLYLESKNID